MQFADLSSFESGSLLEADIVIIGGGPAGLTLAREFFNTQTRILVLESGKRDEEPRFTELNHIESTAEPRRDSLTIARRTKFHGASSSSWTDATQPYGVRSRVFGGSSQVWAGKSTTLDEIDFQARPWVPNSGWPIERAKLGPYFDRAAIALNLGPNCYDEKFWELMGIAAPQPTIDASRLRPFFWQFARSRIDRMDIMRFGQEYATFEAANVRVLMNATVTHIDLNDDRTAFAGLEISTIDGTRSRVKAKVAILAAGGIENPRLLLASRRQCAAGVGNAHDLVGRFLMDHPGATIGHFKAENMPSVVTRFGFYGLRHEGFTKMYVHGLALSEDMQRREALLNCAVYLMGERALDDPFDAAKRLLRGRSESISADILAVISSPGLVAKAIGMRVFQSEYFPSRLKDVIVNFMIATNPNFVAREYQGRGLQHKLSGLSVDAITEQRPDPDNRIVLSDKVDALGMPVARAQWRIGEDERRAFMRLGQLMIEELPRAGLPAPVLEDWIVEQRPQDAVIIDMGHTSGTTRMSGGPKSGVVDANCRVHDIAGLYIIGGSVFPTSGHANPMLTNLALSIRLGDHLKGVLCAESLEVRGTNQAVAEATSDQAVSG